MMIDRAPDQTTREGFIQQLRKILTGLYDPLVLGSSPLSDWIRADHSGDPVIVLRQTLIDAIESLKPLRNAPGGTKTIRVYEILRHRFIEQQIQRTVADLMNLSIRQLQREEKTAIEILADYLWRTYHLEDKAPVRLNDEQSSAENHFTESKIPQNEKELENLIRSIPSEKTNILKVVQDAINTMKPCMDADHISITYREEGSPQDLYLQTPLLRQGLLNIISSAIELVPQGRMDIQTTCHPGEARISVQAWHAAGEVPISHSQENLEIARKLINSCKGVLTFHFPAEEEVQMRKNALAMSAEIDLTATEQTLILVVDDHADTIQLYQRFLADSRYQLLTACDVRQGLSLAEEYNPKIIILDVMIPESDGWVLLSQLRVHPKTQHIPVIVCSIIPQPRLALSLGASNFLQKPVKRVDLLAILDEQMEQMRIKPD